MALDDEAEAFIETPGSLVLDQDRQFDAAQEQLLIGEVEQRLQQAGADALALIFGGHIEKQVSTMAMATGSYGQARNSHDLARLLGYHIVIVLVQVLQRLHALL